MARARLLCILFLVGITECLSAQTIEASWVPTRKKLVVTRLGSAENIDFYDGNSVRFVTGSELDLKMSIGSVKAKNFLVFQLTNEELSFNTQVRNPVFPLYRTTLSAHFDLSEMRLGYAHRRLIYDKQKFNIYMGADVCLAHTRVRDKSFTQQGVNVETIVDSSGQIAFVVVAEELSLNNYPTFRYSKFGVQISGGIGCQRGLTANTYVALQVNGFTNLGYRAELFQGLRMKPAGFRLNLTFGFQFKQHR